MAKLITVDLPVRVRYRGVFFFSSISDVSSVYRPGHTALYGLIMAKPHQIVVSREADGVVHVDVEFKTSYSPFINVAGCGGNRNGVGGGKKW